MKEERFFIQEEEEIYICDRGCPVKNISGEHVRDDSGHLMYEEIAEIYTMEDAEMVLAALNAMEETK